MPLLRITILLLAVSMGLMSQGYALPGKLSGSAEMRYASHSARENGKKVLDASHFTQRYSLLWEKQGLLNAGRAGEYDVALGYQWNRVDSEVNGQDVKIDNPLDKILFRGDVLIAPGGLPFRLHAYSQDLNSTRLVYQELGELFDDQEFDPQKGIITSVNNGSHILSGLTLMAGVNNGQYRGKYRDVFKELPRLLIDFRQSDVRDVKGPNQQHYTDRNLAFVSLNKAKNWFHYRFFTHDDKLDSSNDYERQTYLIGTINHVNRREWVDLTNWIQISTDLSYSQTTPSPGVNELNEKRYDLNFFADAYRNRWRGGSYTSYSRIRDDQTLRKYFSTPLYANGEFSRDTSWRFRFESELENEDIYFSDQKRNYYDYFAAGRLEMLRQQRYNIAPTLEAELKEGDRGKGQALRVGVEAYSNPRYHAQYDLFGSYDLAVYDGKSQAGEPVSYFEQQLQGRIATDLTSELRVGFNQRLTFGNGEYNAGITDRLRAHSEAVSRSNLAPNGSVDGSVFRSISAWYADHRPASRLNNRLQLVYDYLNSPVGTGSQLIVTHNLNYYGRSIDVSWDNELILGDELLSSIGQTLGGNGISSTLAGPAERSFESIGRLTYDPSRIHQNDLRVELEWREFDSGGQDQRYDIQQIYEYILWQDRGVLRKIAGFGEEFEYERYEPISGDEISTYTFTLFTDYYPTRQTLLEARWRYELNTADDSDTMLVFLSGGIDFAKFQMRLDYSYGDRSSGDVEPKRTEHKWEVLVRRTF